MDTGIKIPFTDLKEEIKKYVFKKWQEHWDDHPHNRLYSIQPKLEVRNPSSRISRKEEVLMARLLIRHTRMTHSFLLTKEVQRKCQACKTLLSVKHILIECPEIAIHKEKFYNAYSRQQLFEKIYVNDILSLLKKISINEKILNRKYTYT